MLPRHLHHVKGGSPPDETASAGELLLSALGENAIVKEPGSSYCELWRCVSLIVRPVGVCSTAARVKRPLPGMLVAGNHGPDTDSPAWRGFSRRRFWTQ